MLIFFSLLFLSKKEKSVTAIEGQIGPWKANMPFLKLKIYHNVIVSKPRAS